ncbi:hypothetical protein O3M35_006492 [Rhynocoris fuscipes]|uniref:Uncharacterized protein n=1 Tax=Rhynocoris fuscipes TaxID=488301 RepID=A0AAW1DIY9_9HEMI
MMHTEFSGNLGVEIPSGQGKKYYRKAAHRYVIEIISLFFIFIYNIHIFNFI